MILAAGVDMGAASIVGSLLLLVGSILAVYFRLLEQGAKASSANDAAVAAAANAAIAAKNIGVANGHGDLHNAVTGIYARLDAQDRDAEAERRLRDEGAARQTRMLEALIALQSQLETLRSAQATFATRDELHRLETGIERLNILLGEPEPGWDQRPVIKYIHESIHALRGEITKLQTATQLLADKGIAAVNEASALLEAARHPNQGSQS